MACFPKVSPRTKLLVLDGRGSRNAIQLARTLRSVGLSRAYVVEVMHPKMSLHGVVKRAPHRADTHFLNPTTPLAASVSLELK